MRFSQALRELDKAKRTAPANAGPVSLNRSLNDALADRHNDAPSDALNDPINDPINETLMSAIAPFEPMFAPWRQRPRRRTVQLQCTRTASSNKRQRRWPSQQAFFPPKPSLPANSEGAPARGHAIDLRVNQKPLSKKPAPFSTSCKSCLRGVGNTRRKADSQGRIGVGSNFRG